MGLEHSNSDCMSASFQKHKIQPCRVWVLFSRGTLSSCTVFNVCMAVRIDSQQRPTHSLSLFFSLCIHPDEDKLGQGSPCGFDSSL